MGKRYEQQTPSIVLLAGCDPVTGAYLREALRLRGVDMMHCASRSLLSAVERLQPDAVALALDDAEISIRDVRLVYTGPVVVVGGPGEEAAIAELLDAGADDHVQASTGSVELAARLVALLRRGDDHKRPMHVGPLEVDRERRMVSDHGKELSLTTFEFRALEVLARHNERVVQHHDIITHVWGRDVYDTHTLTTLICRLRRKLAQVQGVKLETVMGIGYRLRATPVAVGMYAAPALGV